jgi:sarcosine oxidase
VDAEVAVIGTGTMGSMALWQLARAGIDAIGFEQFTIGHDRSAAGGESRIFRTAYMEGPEYVPTLLRAYELWRELEGETGLDLLTLNGGLMVGAADHELIRNVLHSIEQFSLPHEVLDAAAMARRYPQHRLLPDEIAILDKTAGVLRPEFAVLAATRRADELGATIIDRTQVTQVVPSSGGVTVHTVDRAYQVRQAIVATGPWTARFAPDLARHITPRRVVLTWYMASDPSAYTADRFPILIRNTGDTRLSAFPTLDGGSVKVAGSASLSNLADPDNLDRNVSPRDLTAVNDAVARFMPGLIPNPIRVSAYMDGYTPDGHAFVGPMPAAPNVWVLGGFSGHGFKFSPAIGQITADLIRHGKTELPITHLDPARHLT